MLARVGLASAVLASLTGAPGAARAEGFGYSYLDAAIIRPHYRDLHDTGTYNHVGVSVAVAPHAHLFAGFSDGSYRVNGIHVNQSDTVGGAGLHAALAADLDAYAELSYGYARASGGGVTVTDTARGVDGGLRLRVTSLLELGASISYVDFGSNDDTAVDLNALIALLGPLALFLDVGGTSDTRSYTVGLRGYF
jgi:hypothetical protein